MMYEWLYSSGPWAVSNAEVARRLQITIGVFINGRDKLRFAKPQYTTTMLSSPWTLWHRGLDAFLETTNNRLAPTALSVESYKVL